LAHAPRRLRYWAPRNHQRDTHPMPHLIIFTLLLLLGLLSTCALM
jgi:hypothetical protein